MAETNTAHVANDTAGRVLTIRRLFNAPPALVFDAFADPRRMLQWLGPRDYPATCVEADLRVGGKWRACLDSAATGEKLWHGGVYQEIVPDRTLAFTFAWDQEDGRPGNETLVHITFEDQASKTLMIFRQSIFETPESCEGHEEGWNSAFDRLEELLAQE
ncbi:MAG: SRPBCC domain-containing protein [Phyllobacterium sp.]|uniref:SRPBCC family protein n=1 Tax=Phyllobacterium sp. TaxID=1871046 RepID=UPI0030F0669F